MADGTCFKSSLELGARNFSHGAKGVQVTEPMTAPTFVSEWVEGWW